MKSHPDEIFLPKGPRAAYPVKKEFDNGIRTYSEAIDHGVGNRGILFNLAYCLAVTQAHQAAGVTYGLAIQAGSCAPAFNNLGMALRPDIGECLQHVWRK